MVINVGKNPYRREADVDVAGNPINTLYNPNASTPPPQARVQQAPDVVANDVEASEVNDLRPLQEEAQMAMNTHLGVGGYNGGGAPDAPMVTADTDGQARISESLGDGHSIAEPNEAPPIDPNMVEAASSVSDIGPV